MFRDLGSVDYEQGQVPGGERHRFRWRTESSGEAVLAVNPMSGAILHEAIVSHNTAGSGTYSITLLDELGVDLLDKQLTGLALNTASIYSLFRSVSYGAAKWSRPLWIMSPEVFFRVTHTVAGTYSGVIDIYAGCRKDAGL